MTKRSNSPVESEDEMEVAEILLQLPYLIKAEYEGTVFSSWRTERKTFVDDSLIQCSLSLSLPSSSSPLPRPTVKEIESTKPDVTGEALSPATPLAFCPSETDDKTKLLRRKYSVKKTKKKYTQRNELLTKEIEQQRKRHYQHLTNTNLLLHRKQELGIQVTASVEVDPSTPMDHDVELVVDQRPDIIEGTVEVELKRRDLCYSHDKNMPINQSTSGLGINLGDDNVGTSDGIPNLNLTSPESMWIMELVRQSSAKTMAAQARLRRRQICRDKNNLRSSLLRR